MKPIHLQLVCIILSLVMLSSCTMEKKLYSRGFHVEWSNYKATNKKDISNKTKGSKASKPKNDFFEEAAKNVYASTDNNTGIVSNTKYNAKTIANAFLKGKQKIVSDTCDNVILHNGEELRVKVMEIDLENIKYKKCENLNGPVYYKPKAEVFMIQYANGLSEVITPVKTVTKTYTLPPPDPDVIYTRTEGFGLAGFFTSFLSVIPLIVFQKTTFLYFVPCVYAALVVGIICTIFGLISIIRGAIKPDHFRGKGFGIVSLILGLLLITLCIIMLSAPLLFL